MASVVLKMSVSLDGYVAPADGSSDWAGAGRSDDGARWTLETVSKAGTHLIGAATYARWAGFWPGAAGPFAQPMNEIPKVVFSDSLASAEWGPATIARGGPGRSRHAPEAGAPRRVPARPGRRAVRSLARSDRLDRRVPPRRPPGHPGSGRAALHHAADHGAREHHRLQRRSRRPRLHGASVIERDRRPETLSQSASGAREEVCAASAIRLILPRRSSHRLASRAIWRCAWARRSSRTVKRVSRPTL